VPFVSTPTNVVVMPPVPTPPSVRAEEGFAALIGVAGKKLNWRRAILFLAANVIASLLYFAALSSTTMLPVAGGYWLLAVWQGLAMSIAAVAAFRLIKNPWVASAVASVVTTLLILPIYGALPNFVWADIMYREQFQQFVLLPLVYSFLFLAASALLTSRLQPLALAIWLGAMSAEIGTPLFAALLRGLGAKQPPDAVLAGGSLVSAICRSLVFTAIIGAGLVYFSRRNRAVAVA